MWKIIVFWVLCDLVGVGDGRIFDLDWVSGKFNFYEFMSFRVFVYRGRWEGRGGSVGVFSFFVI